MNDMQSYVIRAGALLDPLEPELLGPHSVAIEDGFIKEVSDRPLSFQNAVPIDAPDLTLVPGLIDLHVHITATQLDIFGQNRLPNSLIAARSIPILRGMLRRGFTTVRDAGGGDIGWRQAIDAGLIAGPRLFLSGHALSQTGGHGDGRPLADHVNATGCACCFRVGQLCRVVDGVDAVRKSVREELLMGADQIKILASGGVASPSDPIAATGYSEDEIRAIVEEAAARDTYVMAHAYTARAIARAVRCGVRSVEHGNLIDAETAALVRTSGAYVVPTLVTYEALATEGAQLGLPPASVAKIEEVRTAGLHSLELLQSAGVSVGFGTDLLGPSHRLQSNEFVIRRQILTAQQVLQSATTTAAEILRMEGKLGRIQPGAFADLLLVCGNPYGNIECLIGNGENIPLVMKGGRICFSEILGVQ